MKPLVTIDGDSEKSMIFEAVEIQDHAATEGERSVFLSTYNEVSDPVWNAVHDGQLHELKIEREKMTQTFSKVLFRSMNRVYRDDYFADSLNLLILPE